MVEGKTKLYANLSQCRKNAKMNSNATRFISTEKGIYSPKGHLYISLYISLSPSHLFLYRSNTEESDVLISKERYIHLYEEYSDNNKLSSAPWLTYSDRVSIQHHRTQRISQRRRYILMRGMAFLRRLLYRIYKYRQGALLQGWPGLTVMIIMHSLTMTHIWVMGISIFIMTVIHNLISFWRRNIKRAKSAGLLGNMKRYGRAVL